ncbi:DUF4129 domain-containing protein [Ramlibacter tataouinensis]|uniref:Protein-glutamine gamma-glutamyltransferase-like C-terminal domain-containing protein n=1 Tax=Ramlibacter tataouinensis (strain ATCC BAA-407 / DSM 14655 / LMG 21543 / TTB310) TaxID=365046 RepID=F5XY02_RAMTT|nr:DUF4129 domain-containing protein [Ramlibacter tataouinensis]AEG94327.1 hypothetical protein Rta_32160 [Ramlibacter tataouinensis TTB310]
MRWPELVLAACLGLGAPAQLLAQSPSRQEVQQAADVVRSHPDLGGRKKVKTLRLRERDDPSEKQQDPAQWRWVLALFRWMAETARVLVWVGGAVLVALLLVGLRHWLRVRSQAFRMPAGAPPTHVQSLDIRPESLPPQVGAAAAGLWQRGEHVAALSLLYRGALSRLVHGHGLPIKGASTEGECLALARTRLDPAGGAFFSTLVAAWQLAVYGARLPDGTQVLALCREFDTQLPAPAPGPS